jgi:hypothetical protein
VNHPTRILLGAALAVVSCTPSSVTAPKVRAAGPPRVQARIVSRHARQFDEDLASRPAGSQQEEAAAAYILGHLQRAGYLVRLLAVPVGNAVNSIDVLALPPGEDEPQVVVAVPYDSEPSPARGDGEAIGLWLELGRALNAADPRHDVELAALGAEHARAGGGYLGSRRLARLLLDDGQAPLIITLERIGEALEGRFGVFGEDASRLAEVASRLDIPVTALPDPERAGGVALESRHRIFSAAGLEHIAVTGGSQQVGRVLLEYLVPGRPR